MKRFSREIALIGEEPFKKLSQCNVLIIGLGGVGGYALENLVRAGISSFTIVDGDRVDETNINRQIIALNSTVGMYKTEAFAKRIKDINPNARVRAISEFYTKDNYKNILNAPYDYCIDCFDSVPEKVHFIKECKKNGLKIISALGAAGRLKPQFAVADIYSTKNDPLARKLRTLLKKEGVADLKTVYSLTPPDLLLPRELPSISYSPAEMGIIIAKEVINDLIGGIK